MNIENSYHLIVTFVNECMLAVQRAVLWQKGSYDRERESSPKESADTVDIQS